MKSLEEEEELVIPTSAPGNLAVKIRDRNAIERDPCTAVNAIEFSAIRTRIRLTVDDKRFFDDEMPTLTGLTAEQFLALAATPPSE